MISAPATSYALAAFCDRHKMRLTARYRSYLFIKSHVSFVQLHFNTERNPKDMVTQTFYRSIRTFIAEDPVPLVEGESH
jgi:hypothetical protein